MTTSTKTRTIEQRFADAKPYSEEFERLAARVNPKAVLYAEFVRRLERAAAKGARLLDAAETGWFKQRRLAISCFDITDCEVCVLGQVFADKTLDAAEKSGLRPRDMNGGWTAGQILLFGGEDHHDEVEAHGFDALDVSSWKDPFQVEHAREVAYCVLQAAWEHEIRSRRKAS